MKATKTNNGVIVSVMIEDCMQQHIHSTIASFGRTKGTRKKGRDREREREEERGVKGGRGSSWEEDG